jgi:hypothetical protein
MNDDDPMQCLPESISEEADREQSTGLGRLVRLHKWWARRPGVIARVATYLALTEKQSPEDEFLASLGAATPSPTALATATADIRDARWIWAWRDKERELAEGVHVADSPSIPAAPRILDPFAGSGSIPFEALRLGCDAYASDLNPLSYSILRAGLEYPATYSNPNPRQAGSAPDGTWAGLVGELTYWARRVRDLAEARIAHLFPSGEEGKPPRYYLWFHAFRCTTPGCESLVPLQNPQRLTAAHRGVQRWLEFRSTEGGLVPIIVNEPSSTSVRGRSTCPKCNTSLELPAAKIHKEQPIVGAVVYDAKRGCEYREVRPGEQAAYTHWSTDDYRRMNAILEEPSARNVLSELPPHSYSGARRWGWTTFRDLFAPRQLLVALEYANAAREIGGEMLTRGIQEGASEAVLTYLAFFVGHLVGYNSMLCRWDIMRQAAGDAFARHTPVPSFAFVERNPQGLVDLWLAWITPTIEASAAVPRAGTVYLADASSLPFQDDYFDAIVTDPPYYDRIQYSELADYYWAWESMVLQRQESPTRLAERNRVVETRRGDEEAYREALLKALRESFRVLKPGRLFAMLLTSNNRAGYEEYVSLARKAGFDLVNVKNLRERRFGVSDATTIETFLIYYRKPSVRPVREGLRVNATAVLDAAEAGKPVLYEGLARMLLDELEEDDIASLIPPGGKGTRLEMMMEVVAEEDPRALMLEQFGSKGLRNLARQIGIPDEDLSKRGPLDSVLAHYGFFLPSPAKEEGLSQVKDKLTQMAAKIRLAKEKEDIRGPFLSGCTAIERLLRVSVWGWASLAFRSGRDEALLAILKQANPERKAQLDRLSFGDVVDLFRRLPDAIAKSHAGPLIEQKFGRPHPYSPNKPTKFAERIGEVVSLRNKVEHDKDGYWTESSVAALIESTAGTLEKAAGLLDDLGRAGAVPRIAQAIQEIRDLYNRVTYKLNLDNGIDVEARFSTRMELGGSYLYFGSGTNPRPVDPLALSIEEVGKIP